MQVDSLREPVIGATPVQEIEFWFSIGSTYTYLTVMRLPEVARMHDIEFSWRPFSVREIMIEMNNIPFATKPVKEAYMWRDIERRARHYGLPARLPAPYPLQEFDLANRIAVLARGEGWCEDYVRAAYRRWFQDGLEAGGEENLSTVLREIGQDRPRVLREAMDEDVGRAYLAATREARDKGIFGAPTFAVGSEIFWGDDRLDDAIAFAGARP